MKARKEQPVHVEGKASRARLSTLCSVILERRRALTFCALITHRCSQTGLFGQPYFHISPQLRRRVTVRRAFSSAIVWRPIKTHTFTVSAGMQGPSSTTFPRVQIRTNTPPQRFVPHLWHHA